MYELASLAQSMDHIIINPPSYSFYKSILNESEVSAHLPDRVDKLCNYFRLTQYNLPQIIFFKLNYSIVTSDNYCKLL